MTKSYAAKRLLEHGPLDRRQFIEITGWPEQTVANTLCMLVKAGEVVPVKTSAHKWFAYRLA